MENFSKWNHDTNQQEISLLLATTEKCEDNKYHRQLMSKLNRRPSGFITEDMKKIILITEKYSEKEQRYCRNTWQNLS